MKRLMPKSRVALAMLLALSNAAPVAAAPVYQPGAPAVSSDVVQVQERRIIRRADRHRFEHRNNRAYYNGHRGYRKWRRGYREYNGWWFPPAAFALGAIVGGAIERSNDRYGNAHVRWCYDRYRSYRASDNSYQPYNGPRRQCRSPYG